MRESQETEILYQNRRQARKVRIILVGSAFVFLLSLVAGWFIFQTLGLSPVVDSSLKPVAERLAAAGALVAVGAIFLVAMMLYARLYVIDMERIGSQISFATLSLTGTSRRTVDITDFRAGNYHGGQVRTGDFSINAPWLTFYVAGRKWPLILDLQAEKIDLEGVALLAKKAREGGASGQV